MRAPRGRPRPAPGPPRGRSAPRGRRASRPRPATRPAESTGGCDTPSTGVQAIIDDLLAETGASRTTLRLDPSGETFPVVAEALAPGIRSIRDNTSIQVRSGAPFVWIERERTLFVQDDVLDTETPPPAELIELYGVRAQMLAPIFAGERIVGVISVHYAPGPRAWSEADRAALEHAAERVHAEL